jgi:hypothetical protein
MKRSNVFKWTGIGLLAVVLAGAGVFVFLNKTSSSRIVLADEAKEHSQLLHNANGDHACDCFQPWISNVTISNITSTSFDMTWDCGTYTGSAGPAAYQVTYGTTNAKSSIYPTTLPTTAYTHYTVTVPNLTPGTLYHAGVKGCCLSNCSRGGGPTYCKTYQQSGGTSDWTLTTLAGSTGFTIAGIIGTTATGKRVASAKADAGITGVLVTLSGGASKKDTTTSTGAYSFANLQAGTYTVTPTKTGVVFTPLSKTYTLTASVSAQNFVGVTTGVLNTVAENAVMSQVTAAKVTAQDVTITWKTNIPATSSVEYGLTTQYGMNSGVNAEMGYNHYIQLFDLQKGATYHARAVSYTGENANTAAYSSDFTFKVPSFEDRISDRGRIANEPNPASTWTMFTYYLYQPARSVTIDVLTLSGKRVATLESPSSSLGEGWNKVRWDNLSDNYGKRLQDGVYVYRFKFRTATNMEQDIEGSGLRIVR